MPEPHDAAFDAATPGSPGPEVPQRNLTIQPDRLAALEECERVVELLSRPGATSSVGPSGGAVIQCGRKVIGLGESLKAAAAMARVRAARLDHAPLDNAEWTSVRA